MRTSKLKLTIAIVVSAISMNWTQPNAGAAQLHVEQLSPQPGDIITLTVVPDAGETIEDVRMSAFDTARVKFYPRGDGSRRGFVGYPFDRTGGRVTLGAETEIGGRWQTLHATFVGRSRDFPTQHITMNGGTASKMSEKDALHNEKLLVQGTMQNSNPEPLWLGDWIVPAPGQSTSSYGRKRYVNGKWWGQHNGADIKAGTGTPIHVSNAGRVVLSEYLPTLRGNCIVVDHGCNVFSVYMHMSRRLVNVGDSVGKGQLIGLVGATGFVTGPHLHWEVRIGWEPVDPNRVVARGLSF